MWAHKAGSQPKHKAIEHGEIQRTLSGAITDHSATTWRAPPRPRSFVRVTSRWIAQAEQIAHELETILPANLHKTAPQRRFMPNFSNSPPTASCIWSLPRDEPCCRVFGR